MAGRKRAGGAGCRAERTGRAVEAAGADVAGDVVRGRRTRRGIDANVTRIAVAARSRETQTLTVLCLRARLTLINCCQTRSITEETCERK